MLLPGLFFASLFNSQACTVFCDSQGETALAGRSFDIPDNSDLVMVFVPATATAHGWVAFGRASGPCADGMNDQGLFAAVADVPVPGTTVSHKWPADLKDFIEGLLSSCATVEEAVTWCQKQPTPRLGGWVSSWSLGNSKHPFFQRNTFVTPQHVLVADRRGNSVVFEWVRGQLKVIRKTGRYQLMTNFLLSAPELGSYPCARFTTDSRILDDSPKPSLETCEAVLKTTAAGNTKYSLVCDLAGGEVQVYLRRQFEQPKTFRLAVELAKGRHQVELDQWFGVQKPATLEMPKVTPAGTITAAEILRKALEARGGSAAVASIQSIHATGTFEWNLGCFAASPAELFETRFNQSRFVVDQDSSLGLKLGRYDHGYDGQSGWEAQAGATAERLSGKRLAEQRDDAQFFAWQADPKLYQSVQCMGVGSFDGKPCYVLKLVTKSGREVTHYYDTNSFFLSGIMEMVEIEAGPFLQKTSFGDYRAFGGFQFPTRQDWQSEWGVGGVRLDSIEVNTVKPSAFEPPTELLPGNSGRMSQLGKR